MGVLLAMRENLLGTLLARLEDTFVLGTVVMEVEESEAFDSWIVDDDIVVICHYVGVALKDILELRDDKLKENASVRDTSWFMVVFVRPDETKLDDKSTILSTRIADVSDSDAVDDVIVLETIAEEVSHKPEKLNAEARALGELEAVASILYGTIVVILQEIF